MDTTIIKTPRRPKGKRILGEGRGAQNKSFPKLDLKFLNGCFRPDKLGIFKIRTD